MGLFSNPQWGAFSGGPQGNFDIQPQAPWWGLRADGTNPWLQPTPGSLELGRVMGGFGAALDPQGFAGMLYGPAQQMTQNIETQMAVAKQQAANQPQVGTQQQTGTQQKTGQATQTQQAGQQVGQTLQQAGVGAPGAFPALQAMLPQFNPYAALGYGGLGGMGGMGAMQQPVMPAPQMAPQQQMQTQAQPPPQQPPPAIQQTGGGVANQAPLQSPAVLGQQAAAGFPRLQPLTGPLASGVSLDTLNTINQMLQREYIGRQQAQLAAQGGAIGLQQEERAQEAFPGLLARDAAYVNQANAYARDRMMQSNPRYQASQRGQEMWDFEEQQRIKAEYEPWRTFGGEVSGFSQVHPITGKTRDIRPGIGRPVEPREFSPAIAKQAAQNILMKWWPVLKQENPELAETLAADPLSMVLTGMFNKEQPVDMLKLAEAIPTKNDMTRLTILEEFDRTYEAMFGGQSPMSFQIGLLRSKLGMFTADEARRWEKGRLQPPGATTPLPTRTTTIPDQDQRDIEMLMAKRYSLEQAKAAVEEMKKRKK